jgi:hypothetical protein
MMNLVLVRPIMQAQLRPTDPTLAFFHFNIGSLAAKLGEIADAEGYLLKAEKILARNPRAFGGAYIRTLDELVPISDLLGKPDDPTKWRAARQKFRPGQR